MSKNGFKIFLIKNKLENVDIKNHINNYEYWLNSSQKEDAYETIKYLSKNKFEWLIIDHYSLDYRWESLVRPYVKKIVVIDDLDNRKHDCDIIIDQNYSTRKNRYKKNVHLYTSKLLGTKYFINNLNILKYKFIKNQNKIKFLISILIYFGSSDIFNITKKSSKCFFTPL